AVAGGPGPRRYRSAGADSRCSAHAVIGHAPVRRAEHPLPELDITRIESAGATVQVIPPHPVETLIVAGGDLRPALLEIRIPGTQRAGVIGAEIVHILGHEMRF